MTQHCVYRLAGGLLVLDLQSDLVEVGSRVVAPLIPVGQGPAAIPRLEPVLEVDGAPHALRTAEMVAILESQLQGPPVADLGAHSYEITRALDLLLIGV